MQALFKKHGTPEQLVGGKAAWYEGGYDGHTFKVGHLCLSQPYMDGLLQSRPYITPADAHSIFRNAAGSVPFDAATYGKDGLEQFKRTLDEKLAAENARNEEIERANVAKLEAEEEDRKAGIRRSGEEVELCGHLEMEFDSKSKGQGFVALRLANKAHKFSGLNRDEIIKRVRSLAELAGRGTPPLICVERVFA